MVDELQNVRKQIIDINMALEKALKLKKDKNGKRDLMIDNLKNKLYSLSEEANKLIIENKYNKMNSCHHIFAYIDDGEGNEIYYCPKCGLMSVNLDNPDDDRYTKIFLKTGYKAVFVSEDVFIKEDVDDVYKEVLATTIDDYSPKEIAILMLIRLYGLDGYDYGNDSYER